MAWARGERRVCSMVCAPSAEDEDRRRQIAAVAGSQPLEPLKTIAAKRIVIPECA
jgi:hypothetical protein